MKPLIKYRGGKSKELHHILPKIPTYKGRYIEPFFGGGALYFYIEPQHAIINDINSKLISFYLGVRDNFQVLAKELKQIEALYNNNRAKFDTLKTKKPSERVADDNEALYYSIRDMFNGLTESQYSEALLYYFINKTAYSGMIRYNSKGEFNVPFGRYKSINTNLVTSAHSKLLSHAEIFNEDYSTIFQLTKPDDFVFLDPPYDCVFSDYGNAQYKGGFNEQCHERLAQELKKLSCKALLVIGRTPLTERLYGEMIVDEYAKSYAVNIRNRFKASASHILVANFSINKNHIFQWPR